MFDEKMIVGEEEFPNLVEKKILPWIKEEGKEGFYHSEDGTKLHYFYVLHPKEKASIVISHGFCEFVSKYHEVMYYFYQMGYSVFMAEYRGHGYSDREVEEMDKVYVKNYEQYEQDLLGFLEQVVTKESISKKYFLYAHSMGGCIASLFLEDYPKYFKAAVLSAPLLQMNFKNVPEWAVRSLTIWSGLMKKDKEYVPGQHGFDGKPVFSTSSCMSKARYDYLFSERLKDEHYTTYGSSYGWAKASIKAVKRAQKNASKVAIPVLLFQAGLDTMVKPGGQDAFVKKAKNVKMIRYADSKHEIFNALMEDRVDYYRRIFNFFDENR